MNEISLSVTFDTMVATGDKSVMPLESMREAFERRSPFAAECRNGDGYHGAMGPRWDGLPR